MIDSIMVFSDLIDTKMEFRFFQKDLTINCLKVISIKKSFLKKIEIVFILILEKIN